MSARRAALAGLAAAAAALAPGAARACPACAGRDGYGPAALALMAGFILLPFALAAIVWGQARRHKAR